MSLYADYYRRTIAEHTTGLKLVLGGTGLGKTSSLAELLNSDEYPTDTKFIYVANRI
jgi:type II secretory ATPase GspE/PulE/Tfp pilus assembly ATPase PilB-like protein